MLVRSWVIERKHLRCTVGSIAKPSLAEYVRSESQYIGISPASAGSSPARCTDFVLQWLRNVGLCLHEFAYMLPKESVRKLR